LSRTRRWRNFILRGPILAKASLFTGQKAFRILGEPLASLIVFMLEKYHLPWRERDPIRCYPVS
jgi:hypothetical protein